MTDDTNYALLDRYLSGDCAPAEREQAEQWIAADRSRGTLVDWMRSLEAAAKQAPPSWDADELWRGLESRITAAEPARPRSFPNFGGMAEPRPTAWSVHLLRVAAVIALVAGSVALWRLAGSRTGRPESTATRTYSTHRGERAVFSLLDGSRVTLGASSQLDVPDAYDRRSRDVSLQGQAYFEVAPNPAKPFRVHAGRAMTEVLGTRFDVRAYREDSTLAVAVAEGSVAVAIGDSVRAVVLHHGDLARLDSGGGVRVEHGIAIDRYLAWTQGRLEFVNVPLRDVLPQLVRWYDLDIRLGDSALAGRPLTASLGTESADEMLRLLEASLAVRAERHGQVVTLYSMQPH
jgi:transmembrane sensor